MTCDSAHVPAVHEDTGAPQTVSCVQGEVAQGCLATASDPSNSVLLLAALCACREPADMAIC